MMTKAMNHRYMRLMLCLILSILSIACMVNSSNITKLNAIDSDLPQITVEDKTVHRGQTFSVDVSISNNNVGLISLFLSIDYDSSAMVLKNVIQKDALKTLTLTTTNIDTSEGYAIRPFNILYDGKDVDKTNGTLVTLIFDSNIDAPIGEYSINVTYDRENTNIAYETPTDVVISGGTITLISGEFEAIYKDYDGTVLFRKDYNSDDVPNYPETMALPSRAEDDEYSYEFIGFTGEVSSDINTLVFVAEYKLTPKVYQIFYYIDGVYFTVVELAFGSIMESPKVPIQQFKEFYGWYTDEDYKTMSNYATMPSKDIRLYGFYAVDVRERDIPTIRMDATFSDLNYEKVVVTAEITKNTGFNGLTLELEYDRNALTFDSYNENGVLKDMQFDRTKTDDLSIDGFMFYFESATNNYQVGTFLTLYFTVKSNTPDGTYKVDLTYNSNHYPTYVSNSGEVKYTLLDIKGAEIPIGQIDHWTEDLNDERRVEVTSETGKPINVIMEVELITERVDVTNETIEVLVGRNMYMSSAYKIVLKQNDVIIEPDSTLIIKIKLTELEQKGKIKLCYVDDETGELVNVDFRTENGYIIFSTDKLNDYLIFASKAHARTLFNLGFPIILAIATMLYAYRIKQTNPKNKEEVQND